MINRRDDPQTQTRAHLAALRAQLPAAVGLQLGGLRNIGRPDAAPLRSFMVFATDPRCLPYLRRANASAQANIWVRPDPAAAHPWLFLDDVPLQLARRIADKYAAVVVETSKGNCQIRLLASRALDTRERGQVQRALRTLLGTQADAGSTAGDKWGRLAGFRNRKPGADYWTNLVVDTATGDAAPRLDPTPHLDRSPPSPSHPQRGLVVGLDKALPSAARRPRGAEDGGGGYVEEFAFACHALRASVAFDDVVERVASHALERGKRPSADSARRYAESVVHAALEQLWPHEA
jgi:hypothetical protein